MKKKIINVSQFIAKYLKNLGVKNVYMLSGTGSIYLDDAFAHTKGINYICAKHEAAAAVMAEGEAKLTNTIGVVISTTGPGGTNAIGGIVESWVDSVPVLIISGQVFNKQISKNVRSFGVQGFNIIENVKNITNYAAQVKNPKTIKYHLDKAIYYAYKGRPGPVWLDMPFDVQSSKINPSELKAFKPKLKKINYSNILSKIDILISKIKNSKRPVVVFGQAIRQTGSIELFKKFINKLNIPAVSARMAIDILPYNHNLNFGLGGMRGHKYSREILINSDLIIALGTSYTHAFAGSNYNYYNNKKVIMVNIDKNEIIKPGFKNFGILCDIYYFLESINIKLLSQKNKIFFKEWTKYCHKLKKSQQIVTSNMKKNPINSYYMIEIINEISKSNYIFVNDAGSANYVCSQNLKFKKGQREITSGAFYSMGLALPLAIGASVSNKNNTTICITGDGSIELNIQELKTMVNNRLNIKLIIINNGGYASIRKSQDDMTGGRYTDDEQILNFKKIAAAFNIKFEIISNFKNLKKLLKLSFQKQGPVIIEIVCDPNQNIIETH